MASFSPLRGIPRLNFKQCHKVFSSEVSRNFRASSKFFLLFSGEGS